MDSMREKALSELQKVIIFFPGSKVHNVRKGTLETVDYTSVKNHDLRVYTREGNCYPVEDLTKVESE